MSSGPPGQIGHPTRFGPRRVRVSKIRWRLSGRRLRSAPSWLAGAVRLSAWYASDLRSQAAGTALDIGEPEHNCAARQYRDAARTSVLRGYTRVLRAPRHSNTGPIAGPSANRPRRYPWQCPPGRQPAIRGLQYRRPRPCPDR